MSDAADRLSDVRTRIADAATRAQRKAADICLTLPRAAEACPHGLAPTSSTLMQLALGDALAVALLEQRDFSAEDFATLHPGGSLGANLQRVSDIMHTGDSVPLASQGTRMDEAIPGASMLRECCGSEAGLGTLQAWSRPWW